MPDENDIDYTQVKDDDDLLQAHMNRENIRAMSTDTTTFRIAVLTGIQSHGARIEKLEKKIIRLGCIADPAVVKKHEEILTGLGKEFHDMKTSLALTCQKHESDQKAIMEAIGDLKTCKDTNAGNIGTLQKDVAEIQIEKKSNENSYGKLFVFIGFAVTTVLGILSLLVSWKAIEGVKSADEQIKHIYISSQPQNTKHPVVNGNP